MKVNMEKIMRHTNAEWIIAFAEGKQLQFFNTAAEAAEWFDFQGKDDHDPDNGPWNSGDYIKWRIKPEQQWVRLALCEDGMGSWQAFAECDEEEKRDRKSTRLNSSHIPLSRMPSSA